MCAKHQRHHRRVQGGQTLGVYSGKGIRGSGDRPRPFIAIAIWAEALCWPRIVEITLQEFTSAVAWVLCIHTGVSELLAYV